MPSARELQRYRRMVEDVLSGLGRDDVGVGDVREIRDGVLAITLSRGPHTYTTEIPADQLRTRDLARAAVSGALILFSKKVAQETPQGS